jgi:hypothetical protein
VATTRDAAVPNGDSASHETRGFSTGGSAQSCDSLNEGTNCTAVGADDALSRVGDAAGTTDCALENASEMPSSSPPSPPRELSQSKLRPHAAPTLLQPAPPFNSPPLQPLAHPPPPPLSMAPTAVLVVERAAADDITAAKVRAEETECTSGPPVGNPPIRDPLSDVCVEGDCGVDGDSHDDAGSADSAHSGVDFNNIFNRHIVPRARALLAATKAAAISARRAASAAASVAAATGTQTALPFAASILRISGQPAAAAAASRTRQRPRSPSPAARDPFDLHVLALRCRHGDADAPGAPHPTHPFRITGGGFTGVTSVRARARASPSPPMCARPPPLPQQLRARLRRAITEAASLPEIDDIEAATRAGAAAVERYLDAADARARARARVLPTLPTRPPVRSRSATPAALSRGSSKTPSRRAHVCSPSLSGKVSQLRPESTSFGGGGLSPARVEQLLRDFGVALSQELGPRVVEALRAESATSAAPANLIVAPETPPPPPPPTTAATTVTNPPFVAAPSGGAAFSEENSSTQAAAAAVALISARVEAVDARMVSARARVTALRTMVEAANAGHGAAALGGAKLGLVEDTSQRSTAAINTATSSDFARGTVLGELLQGVPITARGRRRVRYE